MKFVTLPPDAAQAAILAHRLRLPDGVIAKGQKLDAGHLARLRAAGVERITVAVLEFGDVEEDCAAARAARHLVGAGVVARPATTGRVNLCAAAPGLVLLDAPRVNALNHIDEAITIATLPLHGLARPGQIVATIKVNPYAVAEPIVAAWEGAATPIAIAPFRPRRCSLIQTLTPALKDNVVEKTLRATEARLAALGSRLAAALRAPHAAEPLAALLCRRVAAGDELILVSGAASIADRGDVIPAAIVAAGGRIDHFGMPVDPGNLLLLGAIGDTPVIGLPGCARTPQLNGFDLVLRRLMANLPVGREEIIGMGVGGLLPDIAARPSPRAAKEDEPELKTPPRIAAIILAAGRSSRMGANKLALRLEGRPVLRHVVDIARAAGISPIVVVLGHEAEKLGKLLADAEVQCVVNADFAQGLSTSLKCGLAALPENIDGALVFLGDMPDVRVELVHQMIAAFDPGEMRGVVVPKRHGKQGHPVLWGRDFFPALFERLAGDIGAKQLIAEYAASVIEIDADHDGVLTDLDTPADFAARQRRR